MKRSYLVLLGLAGLLGITAGSIGCGATSGDRVFDEGSGGKASGSTGAGNGTGQGGMNSSGSGDIGGAFVGSGPTGAGGGGQNNCATDASVDDDKDGFSEAQGDCNDCDPNVNPNAIEVLADPNDPMAKPADEDCNKIVDDVAPSSCDANLDLADQDPVHGAWAIDICKQYTPGQNGYGMISAKYVRADGSPSAYGPQIGILSNFGPNVQPQGGTRLLGLSSGHARLPNQPDACGTLSCYTSGAGTAPAGFPQDVPNCAGQTDINDDVALEVQLKSPSNATGYSFNFKFYSFEYPEWVCTSFNDQFIALVNPAPMGSINGNISFDKQTNPVSVNVAFFDVCNGCPAGPAEMEGTGFDTWNDAGGTTWLKTQAPVKGGDEVNIRFAIWDTGDQAWDSTSVVDNFQWIANGGTVVVQTDPEIPK